MQCVILAGGLGTRMQAHNPSLPKALFDVAGRPFAYWQLEWLASQGVDDVVYCIGHLGNMIVDAVGTGGRWGLSVTYLQEEGALLGTGGAVRGAVASGRLSSSFFVLYGDSYLSVDLPRVHDRFEALGLPALMTVFENDGELDVSNVVLAGDRVARYEKGLDDPPPDMRFIDYGLTEVTAHSIEAAFELAEAADLAPYFSRLATDGQLGAFVVNDRFYEVGSPQGLADLETHLAPRETPDPTTPESGNRA
jgi:MurNAc alpha-1-phosphate uridylyltransferase